MTKAFCDRCKKELDSIYRQSIISTKWRVDGSGHDMGELCESCIEDLDKWIKGEK